MTSKHSVIDLAARICNSFDKPIERLKLEKLCYYAQAWHYSLYKQKLINEDFFAETTGPRLMPLNDRSFVDGSSALQYYEEDECMIGFKPNYERNRLFGQQREDRLVKAVCDWYGPYDGSRLSTLTHSEPPWQKARVVAVKSKMNIPISLKDMADYYTNGHFFYSMLCPIIETYNLNKLCVEGKGTSLVVKGLSEAEEKMYAKVFSVQDPQIGLNEGVDVSGNTFEYYRTDSNILIITPNAKEYIVQSVMAVTKLQTLVQKGSISHHWQDCVDEVEGHRFLYTSPELGIMVNKGTMDDAIKDAVESLKHQYEFYTNSSCSPQDMEEKELVCLAYAVYESSPSDFYALLGLTNTRHQQGEMLNVGYVD